MQNERDDQETGTAQVKGDAGTPLCAVFTAGPATIRTGPGRGFEAAGEAAVGDWLLALPAKDGWSEVAAVASYVLAAFYREAVSDVTTTIFTACIGYLITYAGKSLGEKLSRNKHRLDADGNPLPEDTTTSSDSTNIGKG